MICAQPRRELDVVLPLKTLSSRMLLGFDGRGIGVCIARASNDPTRTRADLNGHVLWFHKRDGWKQVERILEELRDCVDRYFEDTPPTESIDATEESIQKRIDQLCRLSHFHAPFCLTRNGEFTLHSFKQLSVSENAPRFSDSDSEKEHERDVICAQLFYFVKDIAHTHQHHSPRSDSLITLYRSDNDGDRWKHEVIRSLTLSVLRMKRNRGHCSATGALGILAYVRSFRSLFDTDDQPLIPDFTEEHLERSVRAAADQERERLAHEHRKSDTIRNTIIGLAGLLISIASLYSIIIRNDPTKVVEPHPLLLQLGGVLTQHTPLVLGVAFLYAVFVWNRSGILNWENWGIIRGSLRLVIPLGKRAAVGIFGFLAVFALYFGMTILTGSF